MNIDWNAFTPYSSFAGGALIGLAATLLVLFNGRVAGVSGVLGGLLKWVRGDAGWRVAFILGLVVAPGMYALIAPLPAARIDASWIVLALAGLMVGLGTRYGSGCTSGHGICGLSRLSPRSLVATPTFMSAGFVTVFVLRHVAGS